MLSSRVWSCSFSKNLEGEVVFDKMGKVEWSGVESIASGKRERGLFQAHVLIYDVPGVNP